MEELRHLVQANVSMDIDTFTTLNPRVLQVGPAAARSGMGQGRPLAQSARPVHPQGGGVQTARTPDPICQASPLRPFLS